MPERVGASSMSFGGRGLRLAIAEEAEGTRLTASFAGFDCDVVLARPAGHESLSVVIPWSEQRFQCTTKDNTRPASGRVRWEGEEWSFDGAYGCLDFDGNASSSLAADSSSTGRLGRSRPVSLS